MFQEDLKYSLIVKRFFPVETDVEVRIDLRKAKQLEDAKTRQLG